VINLSPSTAIELKTPMEMWQGRPPNYSSLHIFGCPVLHDVQFPREDKAGPKV